MLKLTGLIVMGTGLLLPLAAQPPRDDDHRDRYYDRDHKDYHEWNEREERAWHRYWEEQRHALPLTWRRANEEQRRAYWRWRHEHPDSELWRDRH